ncbi:MAG: UDP-2,3-diacylglucosamine diphosphatase [Gemmatimonadetes bacterium]|nr:UDP-2,3-diacylglucosamine diphosphatase [Gemmatimonadota bacterium]
MLPAPCLILSDVHLGAAPPEAERSLLQLLELAKTEAKSVVLNGDVFDFWFEWKHAMPRVGFRTIAALAALREHGVAVTWIAGNHDCWGGDILTNDAGVTFHTGPWRGDIGGWNTLIEHGDGLRDIEDAPYRRLRTVLRNPFAIWAFRHLMHPDWAAAIAARSSRTSRHMRPGDGGEGLKRVAQAALAAETSLDLYVYGHTHADTLSRGVAGGVYANPGAWMDAPRCLRVTTGQIELLEWGPNGLSEVQQLRQEKRSAQR